MHGEIVWRPPQVRDVPNGQYNADLREPRVGVMLHYDASASDRGALAWFADPRCKVSYHFLVLDDGSWATIAPWDARAWHAGVCRPSQDELRYQDANSAFLGIAAATDDRRQVTVTQMLTVAWLAWVYGFRQHEWDITETWRIVGHDTECWPRGRKIDPTGRDSDNPILSVEDIRALLGTMR